MDRRHFLLTGSLVSAGLPTLSSTATAAETKPSLKGPYVDLTTGKGNMLAAARMNANLDETKIKYGSATGIVSGIRAGEAVRRLPIVENTSANRKADASCENCREARPQQPLRIGGYTFIVAITHC